MVFHYVGLGSYLGEYITIACVLEKCLDSYPKPSACEFFHGTVGDDLAQNMSFRSHSDFIALKETVPTG